jgi:hypothetical protein
MENNIRIKILQFAAYLSNLFWIMAGLSTIGSIYLSTNSFATNLIVGLIFILMGLYIYYKVKYLSEFLTKVEIGEHNRLFKKVIFGEIIFIILFLFVGIIIFSAVLSRVFGEGFPVFD